MKEIIIEKARTLRGSISIPPDKSISHRAVMISALACNETCIKNFLQSDDCLHTLKAFKDLGIRYSLDNSVLRIKGAGLYGLKKPDKKIYVGNSGTTMRLILGILAAQNFEATLEGDDSLNKRPMKRVIEPLRMMGAQIEARRDNFPPITIRGVPLRAILYRQKIASAQVKSSILLAGLYAKGMTKVYQMMKTRDHTERMLKLFSADIKTKNLEISITPKAKLVSPGEIDIPSDFSSAAFFIAAATLVPNSQIIIKNVGINPTRLGFLDNLVAMGAKITLENKKEISNEERADLEIKFKHPLKAIKIEEKDIPSMIDELPIMMVVATQAKGETLIKGASELRVKETDRINSMVVGLKKMGANIEVQENNILIKGPTPLKSAIIDSFGDHRTAMSFGIAGLIGSGKTVIRDAECIQTSFPNFYSTLREVLPK
jgi:3-phosphoshikimate 1-carboxyvinyltransferase